MRSLYQRKFEELELVQSRTARYVLNRCNNLSSVNECYRNCSGTPIKKDEKKNRLTMFYKIDNDQTGIDTGKYLKPLGRVSRHINNQAYEVPFFLTNYYKYSYFPNTIRE